MSSLAKKLLGGRSRTLVTGTLTGSGSLFIPVEVEFVSLTGQGGNGGNNTTYHPGQPYIAPTGNASYPSGFPAYVAAHWEEQTYFGPSQSEITHYVDLTAFPWSYMTTVDGQNPHPSVTTWSIASNSFVTLTDSWDIGNPAMGDVIRYGNYDPVTHASIGPEIVTYVSNSPHVPPRYVDAVGSSSYPGGLPPYSPGQPYVAPYTTGGPYTGASTTATLNSVMVAWAGGYNTGGTGTPSDQTLTSSGAGQTLTYYVGDGGSLSYSYAV